MIKTKNETLSVLSWVNSGPGPGLVCISCFSYNSIWIVGDLLDKPYYVDSIKYKFDDTTPYLDSSSDW